MEVKSVLSLISAGMSELIDWGGIAIEKSYYCVPFKVFEYQEELSKFQAKPFLT